MQASQTLSLAALAAAANAAPPAPTSSDLPKLSGLPKGAGPSGLPKPPTPPSPPKTPGQDDEEETVTCTYDGKDDDKFDYSAVSLREVGARNTLDWRIWLLHKCKPISFWHDVCCPDIQIQVIEIKLAHNTIRFLSTRTTIPPTSSMVWLRFRAGLMARLRLRARSL